MTRMTGPDCVVMCNLINTHTHTRTQTLYTNNGCGKERRIITGPWRPAKVALVRNYLEVYWPSAGGLSAVNVIGT